MTYKSQNNSSPEGETRAEKITALHQKAEEQLKNVRAILRNQGLIRGSDSVSERLHQNVIQITRENVRRRQVEIKSEMDELDISIDNLSTIPGLEELIRTLEDLADEDEEQTRG